jgi:gamma-glutamyl-gamma-aminobutyrate hydrolase PuuD
MIQRNRNRKLVIAVFLLLSVCVWGADVGGRRSPVIGVADASKDGKNATVSRSYIDAVLQSGGIPVVVPIMHDEKKIIELLNTLDGIVFTGGGDFAPTYYNERPIPQLGKVDVSRDEFEMKLVHLAAKRHIPILGICRGLQLINIAFGGSLYQDLAVQYKNNSIEHRQQLPNEEASHAVYVEDHTVFADIVNERMLMVNSSHHQAIKKVAGGFRVAGKSPDEIIEAIEKVDDENWILGVQFHPETRITKDYAMHNIFRRFVDAAGRAEKPDRGGIETSSAATATATVATASSPQAVRRKSSGARLQHIHKSGADTQFFYKFVGDTQYVVYAPVDTVFVSVSEEGPPTSDTAERLSVTKKSKSKSKSKSIKSEPVSVRRPESASAKTPDATKAVVSDIPATSDTLKVQTKADVSGSKKKETHAKRKQYRKELMEKMKQQKKTQKEEKQQAQKAEKERIKKEKQAKKEAKKKEKQSKRQQQKESEKPNKPEMKKEPEKQE